MKLIWNVFYFIFPLVADIYDCPTAIIWSYDELSFLIRNSWRTAILNIYIFHVHKTFLGENTPWNISFRAFHEIRISQQFHCVNITEKCSPFWSLTWNMKILKIDFQNFLYHERLFYWICFYAWLLFLLSMMSTGKFKGKWKHKAKSKLKMVFPILY